MIIRPMTVRVTFIVDVHFDAVNDRTSPSIFLEAEQDARMMIEDNDPRVLVMVDEVVES